MTDAIAATLHSYKSLATRKQLQITLEVPAEYAAQALKMLGVGDPSGSQWFAVTRLKEGGPSAREPAGNVTPSAEGKEQDKPRTPKLRSNIAAVLCKENGDFQMWLAESYPGTWDKHYLIPTGTSESASDLTLKEVLGIASKKELDTDPAAAEMFDRLTTSFAYRNQVRA